MAMPKKSHPQNWKVQNSAGFWKERGMEDLLRAGGYSRLWAPPRVDGRRAGAPELGVDYRPFRKALLL
jgi:hypothetical protein